MRVFGLGNIKECKQVIFASNHASQLDPLLLNIALPFVNHLSPIFYVSRERNFYRDIGIGRWLYGKYLFHALGAHPVYVGLKDYRKSFVNHIKIIHYGGSICIFPEGHRTQDGKIHEGKGGVGFLSTYTGIPVVPLYICGTYDMSLKNFLLRKNIVKMYFGKPIYITEKKELTFEESKIFTAKIMQRLREIALEREKYLSNE